MIWTYLSIAGFIAWVVLLLLPWQPWRTREVLDSDSTSANRDLSLLTVLIPARNEEGVIETTLAGLKAQGTGFKVVLVDDCSTDSTVKRAKNINMPDLKILNGTPTPSGWSGKLWALEQGIRHVHTPLTLLLDADIFLMPGIINALLNKMESGVDMVSLMASLRMVTFWEKLLMPPFIYFFKLLYPFHLSNNPFSRVAAAAGGCILIKTEVIKNTGGFESLKNELIDDCSLAKRVKTHGYKTWTGLTHSVISLRAYNFASIWDMVARTAFTQLRYSMICLLLVSAAMIIMFCVPILGLFTGPSIAAYLSGIAIAIMVTTYIPTLSFYRLSRLRAITLPVCAVLYLAMTWSSAISFWKGAGAHWKGRRYPSV